MEQREVDNMLLSMIQKHFPSLPLSDEHTDWGKWLGFARAVYEAGRASPASAPEGWKWRRHARTRWEAVGHWDSIEEMAYNDMLGRGWDVEKLYSHAAPTPPVSEGVDPVMTKEELIAAAESIGMRFPGASIPPVSEDKDKIIAAANALENIASTSSSTRIRRVANDALTAIRARRKA